MPRRSSSKVGLRDIAEATGLSVNSVSLAMRNSPRIAAATRKKVATAAHKLGYTSDPEMSRLMIKLAERRRQRGIKAEIAYLQTTAKKYKIHREFIEACRKFLQEAGYELEHYFCGDGDFSLRDFERVTTTRGVSGIIVAPLGRGSHEIDLNWQNYAGVAIGRGLTRPNLPKVDADHYHAMNLCYEKLREKGYRRIGGIIPCIYDEIIGNVMRAAFMSNQSFLSKKDQIPIFDYNTPYRQFDPEECRKWIQKYRIDSVIGLEHDILRLRDAGVDTGLVTCRLHYYDNNGISGVLPDGEGVGEATAHLLLSALHHHRYGEPRYTHLSLVPGKWVDRGSM